MAKLTGTENISRIDKLIAEIKVLKNQDTYLREALLKAEKAYRDKNVEFRKKLKEFYSLVDKYTGVPSDKPLAASNRGMAKLVYDYCEEPRTFKEIKDYLKSKGIDMTNSALSTNLYHYQTTGSKDKDGIHSKLEKSGIRHCKYVTVR